MNTENITHGNLAHFTGSQQLFFSPLFRAIKYTEGVQFISANGAGWLVDAILSHGIFTPKVTCEPFILATLKVNVKTKAAVLTFENGNGKKVAQQKFDWTDFPLEEISFYLEDRVLMLPMER
jgi:hypothetical protein